MSQRVREPVYFAFRLVFGFVFANHGASTLFNVPVPSVTGPAAFGAWPYWWAAVIELVGGVLVMLGLGTRIAALICSGSMAFAYFTVHLPHGPLPMQNDGESPALFSWGFLLIAVLGSGPYGLDRLFNRRSTRTENQAVDTSAPAPSASRSN